MNQKIISASIRNKITYSDTLANKTDKLYCQQIKNCPNRACSTGEQNKNNNYECSIDDYLEDSQKYSQISKKQVKGGSTQHQQNQKSYNQVYTDQKEDPPKNSEIRDSNIKNHKDSNLNSQVNHNPNFKWVYVRDIKKYNYVQVLGFMTENGDYKNEKALIKFVSLKKDESDNDVIKNNQAFQDKNIESQSNGNVEDQFQEHNNQGHQILDSLSIKDSEHIQNQNAEKISYKNVQEDMILSSRNEDGDKIKIIKVQESVLKELDKNSRLFNDFNETEEIASCNIIEREETSMTSHLSQSMCYKIGYFQHTKVTLNPGAKLTALKLKAAQIN